MPRSDEEHLLNLVPEDGTAIGNAALKRKFDDLRGSESSPDEYSALRERIIERGWLVKGAGRGGSVKRHPSKVRAADEMPFGFDLESQQVPAAVRATTNRSPAPGGGATTAASARTPRTTTPPGGPQIGSYRHADKRPNNPEVGMVTPDTDPDARKTTWAYDPHLDPVLQFDPARAGIETLIDDALASDDADVMRDALRTLKRRQAAYLQWTGKAERTTFDVDTVSLHVHERIDPASILSALRKDADARAAGQARPTQPDLFAAPFENLPLRDAIDFYRHEKGWSNRLIAGDSLLVMNSLLQKESLAGQVQMIYIDPPYGIRYGSNFQPFVNRRDVKDRADADLTQEPEMIKAFRDTWELGLHSYLTYLRDRLLLARELLTEAGSVFVQISDENVHHVRELMDEVFGVDNFVSEIVVQKTGGQTSDLLASVADYCLWYAKSKPAVRYRQPYFEKVEGLGHGSGARYTMRDHDGCPYQWTALVSNRPPGAFPVLFRGRRAVPTGGYWKTGDQGFRRLILAERVGMGAGTLRYKRLLNDFPAYEISNVWTDVAGTSDKVYVVQTAHAVIQRCLLMTTDPGDLVLDPTCGSGTTAVVAEKWGRRWITCDTSRVAITLAKQRLMTSTYDWFALKYPHEGLKSGFMYRTVPHVTLKSIANNPEIDALHAEGHPAIVDALKALNVALRTQPPAPFVVTEGGRKGARVDFGKPRDAYVKLPSGEEAPVGALLEWEVPFDWPADWPEAARAPFDAFHAARRALQKRIDDSIAAHADQETLYDQPRIDKSRLRVTGPFSVEAVPFPTVLSLDETQPAREADEAIARSGESHRQHAWRDELMKTGIRGKQQQMLKFADLETLPGTHHLHCTGTLADSGERVVVSFGPEHAALEQRQVEMALREAEQLFPRPKMIVFCAFVFDPEAAKDIDALKGITALKAQMNTDLLTEDLKKGRASNQSFWLMGQPDVDVRQRDDGLWEVEVNGFDYFDVNRAEPIHGGASNIAVWMLDPDYDERSLFPRQVFFPMAGSADGWMRLRKDLRAELDAARLDAFHGTVSLPFAAGEHRKIAVKIVDDRGIESLKVVTLEA